MFTENDYVSLETAKLLKKKGFDEFTVGFYGSERGLCIENSLLYNTLNKRVSFVNNLLQVQYEDVIAAAPSLYEAQKWIWEKHKMFVSAAPQSPFTDPLEFFFWIDFPEECIDNYGSLVIVEQFLSFQQAFDAGIQEALKLI